MLRIKSSILDSIILSNQNLRLLKSLGASKFEDPDLLRLERSNCYVCQFKFLYSQGKVPSSSSIDLSKKICCSMCKKSLLLYDFKSSSYLRGLLREEDASVSKIGENQMFFERSRLSILALDEKRDFCFKKSLKDETISIVKSNLSANLGEIFGAVNLLDLNLIGGSKIVSHNNIFDLNNNNDGFNCNENNEPDSDIDDSVDSDKDFRKYSEDFNSDDVKNESLGYNITGSGNDSDLMKVFKGLSKYRVDDFVIREEERVPKTLIGSDRAVFDDHNGYKIVGSYFKKVFGREDIIYACREVYDLKYSNFISDRMEYKAKHYYISSDINDLTNFSMDDFGYDFRCKPRDSFVSNYRILTFDIEFYISNSGRDEFLFLVWPSLVKYDVFTVPKDNQFLDNLILPDGYLRVLVGKDSYVKSNVIFSPYTCIRDTNDLEEFRTNIGAKPDTKVYLNIYMLSKASDLDFTIRTHVKMDVSWDVEENFRVRNEDSLNFGYCKDYCLEGCFCGYFNYLKQPSIRSVRIDRLGHFYEDYDYYKDLRKVIPRINLN